MDGGAGGDWRSEGSGSAEGGAALLALYSPRDSLTLSQKRHRVEAGQVVQLDGVNNNVLSGWQVNHESDRNNESADLICDCLAHHGPGVPKSNSVPGRATPPTSSTMRNQ